MAQIIDFTTARIEKEDNLKDMYEWEGSDWKSFFEDGIAVLAKETGRDPFDVFAEVMHKIMFPDD